MKLKDARDGQMYNTLKIGTQCWLAENLNYETGSSYCYDNDPANCEVYGRLYNWETMMNGASGSESVPSGVQGVCPEGWHIPSVGELNVLSDYFGSPDGGKMKQTGYQYWQSPKTSATNESGFTALPAGAKPGGSIQHLGTAAYFWSSREINESTGWNLYLLYSYPYLQGYVGYKGNNHVSVRCLKD